MTQQREHSGELAFAMPHEQTGAVEAPLVGRVFEVRAAEELTMALEMWEESKQAEPAGGEAPTAFAEYGQPDASNEAILPFVGVVLDYAPGMMIQVERRLDLQEDLYLADHAFVYAPNIKPTRACLPVLPMTMSLEAMAEVAACLAPGCGLLGFEEVKATRWIELADTDVQTLRITARLERYDAERGAYFIGVAINIEGQATPTISATALFGESYLAELSIPFTELNNAHRHSLTAEQLYNERHMFHGPSFQCLTGEIVVGDQGLACELEVRSSEGLFRSTRCPQLLACPTLLDAIGQIMGVWALKHDRFVFPIGLGKLEIYTPTPTVGTRVPVRMEITKSEGKTLHANVEIQDGAGAVWMRIADWRSWKFRWDHRLVNFRRLPHKYLLGQAAPLPELDEDAVCLMLTATEFGNFDPGMLARDRLSMEEMPVFQSYARVPQRQEQWLLGRIVAKDAVRRWVAEQTRATMLHPAAFTIDTDAQGRPFIKTIPSCDKPPLVSIAHCESRAIAVARREAVGVDIERIAPRDVGFVQAFTTAKERDMIDAFPAAERDQWITRLWSAKEAVAKLLGRGFDGAPQSFEAVKIESDGRLQVWHRASRRSFCVQTIQDLGFIIAYANLSEPLLDSQVN